MTAGKHLLVLNYHTAARRPGPGAPQGLSPDALRQHFALIKQTGLSLLDLTDAEQAPPGLSLALTFDGGDSSGYEVALPALLEFDYPAMFLPVVNLIDTLGHLSSAQLNEISVCGFSIGSCGMTARPIKRMMQPELYKEMTMSKTLLEEITGRIVTHFAPSCGWYNGNAAALAESAGYRRLLTAGLRINSLEPSPFVIHRWDVTANTSAALLRKVLLCNGRFTAGLRMAEGIRRLAGRIARAAL